MLRRSQWEETVVENLSPAISAAAREEEPPAGVPDLREVPLGELSRDGHAELLARELLASLQGSARVAVATFNSAI
jgi:FXSXX-COOH protein